VIRLLVSIFAFTSVTVAASHAVAETLTEALAAAYQNNPSINVQRARTRATDENIPIARSSILPRVDAFGEVTSIARRTKSRNPAPPPGTITSDTTDTDGSLGIIARQNLFRGFRTKNALKEAEASIQASREDLRAVVQDVLVAAAEAYVNVLRDQALLRLGQRNVGFLEEQLKAAQDRFEVGENTRTDVAQTQARLAAARSDVSLVRANLNASRAVYRQVIGNEPGQLVLSFPYLRALPSSLEAALASGQERHPVILASIYDTDAAAYQVKQIEGELLPTVSVEGTAETTFGIDDNLYSNSASVSGRVSVPIYQGGGVSARVRQAKENLGLARIQTDVSRAQVRAAVISAWGDLDAAKAAIISAAAQVKAAQIALDGVQEEQRVGQRTTLDVLDAQQELLDAQVSQVLAQRERIVAAFSLIAAVGRLNEHELNLPVARYDATEHYKAVKDKWFGLRTPDGR
jgi:outer membrane protein